MKTAVRLIAVAMVGLSLAACGSSAPLTAKQLARKIPGCGQVTSATPFAAEKQQAACTLPDGALVEIGTFASSAAEQRWIDSGGDPQSPDSLYGGCCIQGHGWAATVGVAGTTGFQPADFRLVIHSIGGRQVEG